MNSSNQENPKQIIYPQSPSPDPYSKLEKWIEFIHTLLTYCVSVSGWFCCSCNPNSVLLYSANINSQSHICDTENEARRSLSCSSALKVCAAWTKWTCRPGHPHRWGPRGNEQPGHAQLLLLWAHLITTFAGCTGNINNISLLKLKDFSGCRGQESHTNRKTV